MILFGKRPVAQQAAVCAEAQAERKACCAPDRPAVHPHAADV